MLHETGGPLLSQAIARREFPVVVQSSDIRALRARALSDPRDEEVAAFVGGYLGVDDRSREALGVALRALGGGEGRARGAFFLNGVFGAGKSHLLGVLALISDGAGLDALRHSHPHLAPSLGHLQQNRAASFTLHFSLDDYASAQWSLEEIFWREAAHEWQRRGFEGEAPQADPGLSRREQWATLEEALEELGCAALTLCIDELSLFLGARGHRELQGDASFLQFVGQRAHAGPFPLRVFAALQKTIEDIGGIEAYSVQQIRDRFSTLPLSLAHVPALIERRLVHVRDEELVASTCTHTWRELSARLPSLDFGPEEWRRLFPFHPPVVALLEAVVARFLSRTRSAALFCARALDQGFASDALLSARIGTDELWAYVWPELEEHPDLRALDEVWRAWRSDLPEIAQNASDVAAMERVMRALLLFKIAGVAPDVSQLAGTLALESGLRGEAHLDWVQVLAERLRRRGGHMAVEKRAGAWSDRYSIDVGMRAGEAARRALRSALEALPTGDARISRHAIECCREAQLPLREVDEARSFSLFWLHSPRSVCAVLWREDDGAFLDWAANRALALASPGARDELLLLVAPPFSGRESVREAFDELCVRLPSQSRARARLLLWLGRAPLENEWLLARESAAASGLRDDPALLDNRRGRAVLQHVLEEQAAREHQLSRACARLLREGDVLCGDGGATDAADLSFESGWGGTLEALAGWALPQLYPRFEALAPRARVLTPSVCDQLCLEILRRPTEAPFFAPSLERAVRAIAEPLGLARASAGRWQIGSGLSGLASALDEALASQPGASQPGPALYAALEDSFARGVWGLTPEQFAMLACARLRGGHWQALDARGQVLAPGQIGMPLRRSVHALRRGELLASEDWACIIELVSEAGLERGMEAGRRAPTFEEQEAARAALSSWAEERRGESELLRARLHQLMRQLGHESAQWLRAFESLSQAERAWRPLEGPTGTALQTLARVAGGEWNQAWREWQNLREMVSQQIVPLLQAHAFLSHPLLQLEGEDEAARRALLDRLSQGEDVLGDATLIPEAHALWEGYARRYEQWHRTQHEAARWLSLQRLNASDEWRAAQRLDELSNASMGGFAQAREAWQEALEGRCGRDGALAPGEAACSSCRLPLNQRLPLPAPQQVLAPIHADIQKLHSLLQEPDLRERLARSSDAGAADWLSWDGDVQVLAALAQGPALGVLDQALQPRRRVQRSLENLTQVLAGCRTKAECERAFASWLEGGDLLRDEDELEWREED
jgi:hypothetical protein